METKYPAVLLLHNNPDWKKGDKVNIRTKDGKLMEKKLARLCKDCSIGDRLHTPRGLILEVLQDKISLKKEIQVLKSALRREKHTSDLYRSILSDIDEGKGCERTKDRRHGNQIIVLHDRMQKRIKNALK